MSNFEERNQHRDSYGRFRAILHLSMGSLYVLAGLALVYARYTQAMELPLAYVIGALMFVYGIFRIWRGFKDMQLLRRQR